MTPEECYEHIRDLLTADTIEDAVVLKPPRACRLSYGPYEDVSRAYEIHLDRTFKIAGELDHHFIPFTARLMVLRDRWQICPFSEKGPLREFARLFDFTPSVNRTPPFRLV
jgi:hypothetical protein